MRAKRAGPSLMPRLQHKPRIAAAAIATSMLSGARSRTDRSKAYVLTTTRATHERLYPSMPGHEIVGRVRRAGAAVTRHKVGDLVGVGCQEVLDFCAKNDVTPNILIIPIQEINDA